MWLQPSLARERGMAVCPGNCQKGRGECAGRRREGRKGKNVFKKHKTLDGNDVALKGVAFQPRVSEQKGTSSMPSVMGSGSLWPF